MRYVLEVNHFENDVMLSNIGKKILQGQCYKTFLSVIYVFRTKLECLLQQAGKACQGQTREY